MRKSDESSISTPEPQANAISGATTSRLDSLLIRVLSPTQQEWERALRMTKEQEKRMRGTDILSD